MRVAICHGRLGAELADAVRTAFPEAAVETIDGTVPAEMVPLDALVGYRFPDGLLSRCRGLRLLQLTSMGFDHIDPTEVPEGAAVATAGSLSARAVAEFVWMALLALAKDAPALVRQQLARVWTLPRATTIDGTTLVLVGLGAVGTEVARRACGFGVRVVGVNASGRDHRLVDEVHPTTELVDVVRRADHLVVAVPGGMSTRDLIDAEVLANLKHGATLINVSRASVVDSTAVVGALREGRLQAALLDVHGQLPPADELWDVPNLWVTPHCAFYEPTEARSLGELVVENLTRMTRGVPIRNQVLPTSA